MKNQKNLWRLVLNLKAFKRRCFDKYLKLLIAGPGDRGGLFEKLYNPLRVSLELLSELERKTVGFSRKILDMVTKPHSTLPENLFKRVCIFYTLILFYICRSGAIKIQLFRDKFRQMHKYCILRVQRNNLGNFVFWNEKTSSNYLGPWTENFRLHGKFSVAGLVKGQFAGSEERILKSLILWIKIFQIFRNFSWNTFWC